MMSPGWLNDIVRAFGRQMGLRQFALDDRGVAGVRFETGLALRFEYARESLMVTAGVPMAASADGLRRLLQAAHPAVRRPVVRAAYLARTGEGLFVVRLPERDVSVTALEAVFNRLWEAAETLRRSVS